MADKSREAFRTISEVADWLDVPTHVLRFWESRFSQIKPVKRAGGRRYYRPSDMRVIGGVKVLLHDQGMTIRGVQKLFREEGIKHVSSFAPEIYDPSLGTVAPSPDGLSVDHPSAPANAARSTREAALDPIDPPPEETPAEAPAPVMFRHSAPAPEARAEPEDTAPDPTPPPSPPETTEPEPAPEIAEPPAPAIPATPDVPLTDAADDDPAFARAPGISARLKALTHDQLAAHRQDLENAAERLQALLDRAS